MGNIFSIIIYQPLYNALIALYNFIPDLGVAIILLTVIIRFLLLPVAKKSIESQKKLQEIQPEIKALQAKYKNDKQRQGQETMALYKKYNINPASGCLPLIIQIIFLIALYKVFDAGLHGNGKELIYSFIENPGNLNSISLGFLDLMKKNIPLAIISAILQFWQTKMMIKAQPKKATTAKEDEPDFSTIMQNQMLYMGPIMTLIVGINFPAGLVLYWITTTIFMIIQQHFVLQQTAKQTTKELTQA